MQSAEHHPSPADFPDDPPPEPPYEPALEECCGSGCEPCIFDTYAAELNAYRAAAMAWQQRHPDVKLDIR
ncbi:oxidoreductase-like domain-containing protein [Andreprevotia chitinilytica]|uniref:oxidoreductase-like domain-containing protein n=1 Tax=Andreprevotia chitinilytica TaxID=396808 RepID=UPI0009FD021E|nr:oxidoreductase-like domain-containing protein [Andreprevotia chitinilytica]